MLRVHSQSHLPLRPPCQFQILGRWYLHCSCQCSARHLSASCCHAAWWTASSQWQPRLQLKCRGMGNADAPVNWTSSTQLATYSKWLVTLSLASIGKHLEEFQVNSNSQTLHFPCSAMHQKQHDDMNDMNNGLCSVCRGKKQRSS